MREPAAWFLSGPGGHETVYRREQIEPCIALMAKISGNDTDDYTATALYVDPGVKEAPLQDNAALRTLFALPPVTASTGTALEASQLPQQEAVTGDPELDAMLWLRAVIKTGQPGLIAKALEAALLIETPPAELEKRYAAHIRAKFPNNPFEVVFGTHGFANLEDLAKESIEKLAKQHEALARFGSVDNLFALTAAEKACKKALRGLKRDKAFGRYDAAEADARFAKYPDMVPHTLADCLFIQAQGGALYWLRHASRDNAGDHLPAFDEHEAYCFRSMARIAPRSKEEALAVLDYLDDDHLDRIEAPAILRNLVSGGWA